MATSTAVNAAPVCAAGQQPSRLVHHRNLVLAFRPINPTEDLHKSPPPTRGARSLRSDLMDSALRRDTPLADGSLQRPTGPPSITRDQRLRAGKWSSRRRLK